MLPMGTETPTNFPFCSAGPVLVTKFPRIIPIAIAKNIQNARNRSRRPRLLNAETLVEGPSSSCFSTSVTGSWGSPLGRVGTGSDEEFSGTGLDFLESLSLNILTRIIIWEQAHDLYFYLPQGQGRERMILGIEKRWMYMIGAIGFIS